jgi:hypothetical protein
MGDDSIDAIIFDINMGYLVTLHRTHAPLKQIKQQQDALAVD